MESELRTCDACGARVHKLQTHKNRYAQYICRDCRASGVRAVGTKSIRYFWSRIPVLALGAIGGLLVIVLLFVLALLADSLHSYSNGGMVDDLKGAVRSLNQLAH